MSSHDDFGLYARSPTANQEQELFLRVISVSQHPAKAGKGNAVTVTAPTGNIATGQ